MMRDPPIISPVISALGIAPRFARGNVRDLRVRWAYEEIGQRYATHLVDFRAKGSDYPRWQPFDQVPALREGGVEVFESGAILLRIGEQDERLLPREEQARWRAISWTFAALNSVEPFVFVPAILAVVAKDEPWLAQAREALRPLARQRLMRLTDALGGSEWLAGAFSIADIAMVTTLRMAEDRLLEDYPLLLAYRTRGTGRPAFTRALEAQMNDFSEKPEPKMEGA